MNTLFQARLESTLEDIMRQNERAALLVKAEAFFTCVDLSDVEYLYVTQYGGSIQVEFTLRDDRKDSHIAHNIAQALGMDFTKRQSWDGSSLVYFGTLTHAETGEPVLEVTIRGAVPATCHIEEEVVPLTEEEIEAARNRVQTVRKVRKIVCVD